VDIDFVQPIDHKPFSQHEADKAQGWNQPIDKLGNNSHALLKAKHVPISDIDWLSCASVKSGG